jgi:hypothetical protein
MRYLSIQNIYIVGLFASLLWDLIDRYFQGNPIQVKVDEDGYDLSYVIYIAMAILWPVMLALYIATIAVGAKRARQIGDDWFKKRGIDVDHEDDAQ